MKKAVDRQGSTVFGWLTRQNAELLGPALDHAYPVDDTRCFAEALEAIDEAERQVWCGALRADKIDE